MLHGTYQPVTALCPRGGLMIIWPSRCSLQVSWHVGVSVSLA